MTDEAILTELTKIFQEVFEDESLVATPSQTAADVERWDSLTHVDLIVTVEQHFGIRISTREVQRLKEVGDLVRLISNLVGDP